MTVVLGSICDSGKAIVLASDRMTTYYLGKYEYEHEKPKFRCVNSYVIGTAGVVVHGEGIITNFKKRIEQTTTNTNNTIGISDGAKLLEDVYLEYRQNYVERIYLKPFGLNFEQYNQNHSIYNPELNSLVFNLLQTYDLGVDMILLGFENGLPRIFGISDPGVSIPCHELGYFSIGIGHDHVLNYFVVNKYKISTSLNEAFYFAFEAKKSSEVAAGIGSCTDMMIIRPNKPPVEIPNESEIILKMNNIFDSKKEKEKKLYQSTIKKELEKINFDKLLG